MTKNGIAPIERGMLCQKLQLLAHLAQLSWTRRVKATEIIEAMNIFQDHPLYVREQGVVEAVDDKDADVDKGGF